MSATPESSTRCLSREEVAAFREHGVVMVKGLFCESWVKIIDSAVSRAMANPSPVSAIFSDPKRGFQMEVGLFVTDPGINDLVYRSPLAGIAQQAMESHTVHFFYDQMFTKKAGNHTATPWHHDLTFWPLAGSQICSIWVPLDPVTRESSGLEFVRGSHRWPNRFKAISPMYNQQLVNPEHEDVPDIDARRGDYDVVGWAMEPGDLLLFHPLTLHGSSGNYDVERSRRALAFRWLGDDVTYAPTSHTMPFPVEGIAPGDRISEPSFKRVI